MRKNEFVMRGQTVSGTTEKLSFSGHKMGYGYRLVEFQIYPGLNIGGQTFEGSATITAAKTAEDAINPDFTNEGLIATAFLTKGTSVNTPTSPVSIVNDTFIITQDLIIKVNETEADAPVNWQCKFMPVKLSGSEEAVTNYKQFMISDG